MILAFHPIINQLHIKTIKLWKIKYYRSKIKKMRKHMRVNLVLMKFFFRLSQIQLQILINKQIFKYKLHLNPHLLQY